MPIYELRCVCGQETEVILGMNETPANCQSCGAAMVKQPTFPAMVRIKGEGGYPSRRKYFRGTAPFCGSAREWNKYENNPFDGGKEGEHGE